MVIEENVATYLKVMDGHFQDGEVEVGDARGGVGGGAVADAEHVGEGVALDLGPARYGRHRRPLFDKAEVSGS